MTHYLIDYSNLFVIFKFIFYLDIGKCFGNKLFMYFSAKQHLQAVCYI